VTHYREDEGAPRRREHFCPETSTNVAVEYGVDYNFPI